MSRETNAERLSRIISGSKYEAENEERLDELFRFYAETGELAPKHCSQLLNILASWRTCERCVYWDPNEDSVELMSDQGVCRAASVLGDEQLDAIHKTWSCGYWKERIHDFKERDGETTG